MIKGKVQDSVVSVCGEYLSGNVNLRSDYHKGVIFNRTSASFGEELPPIVFDEQDWETEDQIKRRLREHVDNYLAERAT